MFFKGSNKGSPTWLIAFLGNPGPKYEKTRHNAGFMAAHALEANKKIKINRIKYKALTALTDIGEQKVFIMMPQTYMNLSGDAIAPAAQFYKIPTENIIIVFDDFNIPLGKLKIKRDGSDGGHNGMKSVIARLGTSNFPRIKIGIGAPPHPDYDIFDWVVGKPSDQELKIIAEAAAKASEAAQELIINGVNSAMNKYNS